MATERGKHAGARLGELSSREVEELVVKLAKEGTTPSRIGTILRDQHAVPSIKEATGKSVKQILDTHDIKPELPEDLTNKIRRAVDLYSHLDRNPRDFGSKRALEVVEAEINKWGPAIKAAGQYAD